MAHILVVAELANHSHSPSELRKVTLPTVTFAREVASITGGDVFLLLLGHQIGTLADYATTIDGVDHVLVVDSPTYAHYLAENFAPAVVKVALDIHATVVAAPASTFGKDFLPRVAAKLQAGMVSEAMGVAENDDGGLVYKRPLWAGNIISSVEVSTPIHVVSVRTSEFAAASVCTNGKADVQSLDLGIAPVDNVEFVSFEQVKSERPELTDADVIVAGGRGLKSEENFQLVKDLADALGGAVGATRAAVDAGYAPNDWQIGQTGKIVAPNLYIAVAISGAIQHLAGMKNSKTIVAINSDPNAPIFQVADYGLVGDAFTLVPELTKQLK